jgi:hypothetical protein
MDKEFIPYEQALALKELGFEEPCLGYYIELKNPVEGLLEIGLDNEYLQAPLYQQAFRWFREKRYRFNIVNDSTDINGNYYYDVFFNGKFLFETDYIYKTYEEAELACLKKLIEIVK